MSHRFEDLKARFLGEVERAEAWAREQAAKHAEKQRRPRVSWDRVVFVEEGEVRGDSLDGANLRSVDEYAARFVQLLQEGRSDWINFNTDGVCGDALVIVVEHGWTYDPGGFAPEHIHVKLCGPKCMTGFTRFALPGPSA